jgi:chromosome partitioning protein
VKAAGVRHEDAAAWLAAQGIEVCPTVLGKRIIYQDAYARGLGVAEVDPAGKAASEIRAVYLYASGLLGLPTRRQHDGDIEEQRAGERAA